MMAQRPFHHQRPLAVCAAAYGAGVWAGVRFPWQPALYGLGLLAALGLIWLLPRAKRKRIAGFMAAALFVGLLAGGRAGHPIVPEAGKYQVTGVAASDLMLREDGRAAGYLENVTLTDETGRETRLSRIYWTYYPDAEDPFLPKEGDRASFSGKVYLPKGQENPYGFDFRLYLLTQGACAGVSGASEASVTGHPGRGLASLTYHARQALGDRLREVFGEGSALPLALLIGQRDELPQETAQRFSDAGVAHLLAVSGLHVGLLAAVVMLPLRRLAGVKTRLCVLTVFLLLYCALLDFAAPVVRASLLMVFAQARRLTRRMGDPLTTLSAAFLLILVLRPLALFTASFQLSFGAVLGIVLLEPTLKTRFSSLRPRFLRDGLRVTLSATAGVALPTIQIFHRFSWAGIVLNPLLCALFGLLLPLYALTLAVGCVFLSAGQVLAAGMNGISRLLMGAVEAIGGLPFVTVRLPFLPWYCLSAVILAGWLATRYCVWPRRKRILAGTAAVALAFGCWRMTVCRDVRYIQLSVGQEDAALILDGSETTVIDVGEYGGDVASFLLSEGRRADRLILTHLHRDHCLGLRQLIDERVPIGAVYLPTGAEETDVDPDCAALMAEIRALGVPVFEMCAGDAFRSGRVTLEATWPYRDAVRPGADANRYSLCLLADLDGVRLLTAGDLDGDYERYAARDADLLKAAHHGSKNSTGLAFLEAVTPSAVLIAAGGSASLPHPDLLARLDGLGIPWYSTDRDGAIIVTCRGGEADISTYLKE